MLKTSGSKASGTTTRMDEKKNNNKRNQLNKLKHIYDHYILILVLACYIKASSGTGY